MKKLSFNENWLCNGQPVTLPHDAMLHEQRSSENKSGSAGAYFPGGVYTYEKRFTAPVEWADKHVLMQFEGAYKNARVRLNGKELGGAAYGYIPFFVCLDGELNYGGENTLSVVTDSQDQPDSRWYTGSGIYRPVWLWVGEKDGLEPGSVKISTLDVQPARVRIDAPEGTTFEILDADTVILSGTPGEYELPGAKLWSDETPWLYTLRAKRNGDELEERFGVRKIEWSPKGLFINGKETLLRGGCVHHDSGILGAATYDESEWRRVKTLKEAGYNAIRSAHNPASRAMIEACDALGMYLMDESWDMWYKHKSKYDYASQFTEQWQGDLRAMVERDYNHPSVILYSIGNEVSEPAQEKGVALAREMARLIKSIDPIRPVTGGFNLMIIANSSKGKDLYNGDEGGRDESGDKKMSGMNSTLFNMITQMVGTGMNKAANSKKADLATSPLLAELDIGGYNYASGRYPLEGKAHPERVIFGSETFPQDIAKNWAMVKKYPYLIGDFMWTAWDYLGEVGLGAWAYTPDGKGFNKPYPWLLADAGALDILGNPNGEAFWAQAVWGKLLAPKIAVQPMNHESKPAKGVWRGTNAVPSWSWRGCEGKAATVEVYFDCACVELMLNGKTIGKKKVRDCRAVFQTRYAPGTLTAVAYGADGRETGRSELRTAKSAAVHILPEKRRVRPGEIVFVPVTIGDGETVESNADRKLSVSVTGGELLAFGSANPRTEERFDAGTYTTYYGRALAVVRAGEDGKMTLRVGDEEAIVEKE